MRADIALTLSSPYATIRSIVISGSSINTLERGFICPGCTHHVRPSPARQPGLPVTSKNLGLVPLLRGGGAEPPIDCALASEALDCGDLTATKPPYFGRLPDLLH